MEKKPNPKAQMILGKWTLNLETRRITVRSQKEVRSSDTGDGGRGTLLRTEKHSCRMIIHSVEMISDKLDRVLLSVCMQGSRTTVTKTVPSNRTDIDGNPEKDVKTSYSLDKAASLLSRTLDIKTTTALKAILSPLPEDDHDQASADFNTTEPAYVEA